jgi:hypothetical protein
MTSREITATRYEADHNHLFINDALKSQKKVLIIPTGGKNPFERKELTIGGIDQWIEVPFKEAIEIQEQWDKEKYEYYKIIYEK